MNPLDYSDFPMLGKWKVIRAINKGKEIPEPMQEGEFLHDGTCIHLIKSLDQTKVIRLTGKYFFIPPDHVWAEMRPNEKGSTQKIIINGDQAELHANGCIHYLRKINETEFTEPVIDCR